MGEGTNVPSEGHTHCRRSKLALTSPSGSQALPRHCAPIQPSSARREAFPLPPYLMLRGHVTKLPAHYPQRLSRASLVMTLLHTDCPITLSPSRTPPATLTPSSFMFSGSPMFSPELGESPGHPDCSSCHPPASQLGSQSHPKESIEEGRANFWLMVSVRGYLAVHAHGREGGRGKGSRVPTFPQMLPMA